MSKKLHYISFFPGDWLRDNISACSLSAQALWLRLMFIMHDSQRYGYLTINGHAASDEWVASRVGCPVTTYRELLAELDRAGVPSRTSDGIIFSRRMVRDAERRANDAARQRKHRGREVEPCHGDVTHLSRDKSSSSSTSINSSPSPKLASNKLGDGDDGRSLTEWEGIASRLNLCGVNTISKTIKNAKENGLSTAHVTAIIDHWSKNQGAWTAGYLAWRISEGTPSQAAGDGWPPASTARTNAEKQAANKQKKNGDALAFRIITEGRKQKKTDGQIMGELTVQGLEWPK